MKKIFFVFGVLSCVASNVAFASVEQYVAAVENISAQYKQDTRKFFNGLNSQQTSFSVQQQTQFCGIVGNYVAQLYQAVDQNRESLDRQYRQMSKQDVINQVMSSKEMLILKKYNIQCDLK